MNARALISTRAGSKSEQDALSQLFGEEPKRLRPKPNINIESSGDADTDKVMPRFNVFSQQEEVIQSGNIEAAYEKALSDDGTAWDFSPLTAFWCAFCGFLLLHLKKKSGTRNGSSLKISSSLLALLSCSSSHFLPCMQL